jgi:hypothetical protein
MRFGRWQVVARDPRGHGIAGHRDTDSSQCSRDVRDADGQLAVEFAGAFLFLLSR